MVRIIIPTSETEDAIQKEKLISELLYRAHDSIIKELISYNNDLLALDDVLRELDKDKK